MNDKSSDFKEHLLAEQNVPNITNPSSPPPNANPSLVPSLNSPGSPGSTRDPKRRVLFPTNQYPETAGVNALRNSPDIQDSMASQINQSSLLDLPDFNLTPNPDLPDFDLNQSDIIGANTMINPQLSSVILKAQPLLNLQSGTGFLESISNLDLNSIADTGAPHLPMLPTQGSTCDFEDSITPTELSDKFTIIPANNINDLVPQSDVSKVEINGQAPQLALNSEGIPIRTCEICRQIVDFDGLFANGLYYHKTCAKCFTCGVQIQPQICAYLTDVLVCTDCAKCSSVRSLINASQPTEKLPHCSICNEVINGIKSFITLDNNIFVHTNCLSCYECSKVIIKGQQKILNGKILCRKCFTYASEKICSVCHESILGDFVRCHKKFYHKEHFTCSVCKSILHGNNYIMHHNKLFCPSHGTYFTDHCAFCKKPLYLTDEEKIRFNGKIYHTVCFVCRVCGCDLSPETAKLYHNRPHCINCFKRRTEERNEQFMEDETKKHKHYPQNSINRITKYMNEGIVVILPQYESKEDRFLETAVTTKSEEDHTINPRFLRLSSLEFEDL